MKRIEQIYETVRELCREQLRQDGKIAGVTTDEIAVRMNIQRTNASSDLNSLVKDGRLEKLEGKPVFYRTNGERTAPEQIMQPLSALDEIIGAGRSLKNAVQQAKAAIMYPPLGLHTLLLGETGVGKSMFAEAMFRYAQDIGRVKIDAPFVAFNCADYAHNPQLLLAQLFGVKKGSYTGAESDKAGVVAKANMGILFLDEVHRLPPEGQEMLFYLIDKGMYRSLGDTEELKKVQVLIFCATTENPDSSLLKTFVRRIPMVINLPPLRQRTMNERWELVKCFFRREVQVLQSPVSVSLNSLKAFLMYDCPNNIGQLKGDIKLSCARAFLDFMGKKNNGIRVCSEDLPAHVRRGLIKYKEYRGAIDKIGLAEEIVFPVAKEDIILPRQTDLSIYEMMEQKIQLLRQKGLSEEDIQLILGLDIDAYLKQYMSKFRRDNLQELYKIVDKQIVEIVRRFLQYAGQKMDRSFEETILFAMTIHVSSAIERLREGKPIVNLQLAEIQRSYREEFEVADELGRMIKAAMDITVPPDEIGFMTMFLTVDNQKRKDGQGRVGIIVAMHGNSTASSMVDVANRLLGEKHIIGYDMPLEQKPEAALEEISRLVIQQDQGQGVLLLVDMGSLVMFGDMIYERTAIPIKTVEMVSTPVVLEAARKAIMRLPLEEIYRAINELSPYVGRMYWNNTNFSYNLQGDVIVTACITGKGTAIKLKKIVEDLAKQQGRKIDVIPVEISNQDHYNYKIAQIKREKNLLAVVSSIRPEDSSINYISPQELLAGKACLFPTDFKGQEKGKTSVEAVMDRMSFMQDVIDQNLKINGTAFMAAFEKFYTVLSQKGLAITEDCMIGLILHLACVVEKLSVGGFVPERQVNEAELQENSEQYALVLEAVHYLEEKFNVRLPAGECLNVLGLIAMTS
ncbi:phosphotransferase system mannose-type iia component [Lucifera butyrica]|uniref:Phosphotransferase system mannose-type iia component n=1 Tax=Lucifera butyrica TaxID=1351585 RepID=A0A498R7U6_9FIRM|nr:sigma-54-dependent transcriptional regulator [Lucifera butyrica]VBB06987.1 phosphotransferase system mannose-type iia component [Lucifera butyrica]